MGEGTLFRVQMLHDWVHAKDSLFYYIHILLVVPHKAVVHDVVMCYVEILWRKTDTLMEVH